MSTSAIYGPAFTMSPASIDPTTHSTVFRLPIPCSVSSCTYRFCGSVTYGEFAGGAASAAVLQSSAAATAARSRLILFMAVAQLAVTTETDFGVATPVTAGGGFVPVWLVPTEAAGVLPAEPP